MKSLKPILISALLLITAACGGGGGGSTPPPASNTVAGVAAAGIIKGGTVKVFGPYSSVSGADKKQIGATVQTSLTTGAYSVDLGSYTGPVIVEVSGGSYVDEATGATTSIPAGAPLRAVAVSSTGSVNVAVTPLTELAAKQAATLAGAGVKLTDTTINQANAQVSDLFKVDIIATQPLDASAPLVGTQAQKDYTLALAALSQYTKDSLLPDVKTTLDNLAITAAGSMPLVEVTKISTALSNFLDPANTNNKTGATVTDVSDNLKNLGKTTITLTIALAGTGVKGVETDIVLPANVSVATEAGALPVATQSGVFTKLVGGANATPAGSVVIAGTVHLIFNDPDTALPAGDILTVKAEVAAGVVPPAASAFTLANSKLKDGGGVIVGGATISVH